MSPWKRRQVITASAAMGVGFGMGSSGGHVKRIVGGIAGGDGDDDHAFALDQGFADGFYVANSADELGAPGELPALAITMDDGLFVHPEDSEVTGEPMPELKSQSVQVAQSVDELDEPDLFPAVAITADDGIFIQMGDG